MLPLLRFAGDGAEHSLRDAIESLAGEFKLSDEERRELLPSGQQEVFANRVGWARTYMKKAGLLRTTRRGFFQITERGQSALGQNPARIDARFLEQVSGVQRVQGSAEAARYQRRDREGGGADTHAGGGIGASLPEFTERLGSGPPYPNQAESPGTFRASGCGASRQDGLRRQPEGRRARHRQER